VMVQLPFTITFSGNCQNFIIENSKANIHITKAENVTISNCNELFAGKFRLELPLQLKELSIQETMFRHCWTVTNQIGNLRMYKVVFTYGSVFTLAHECKSIILSQCSGNFNFFGKMSLSVIQNNLYNSEFKVDLDNGNITNLSAFAILLEIDNSLLCKVRHFIMNFVEWKNMMLLVLNDDIVHFEVRQFYGVIRLSGIIQGKIMASGFEGNMRVAKLDNKPTYDVKITNWTVLGKLTINCLAQFLDLVKLSINNSTNELLILNRYNNLFINNIASSITIKFCPYLNNICLVRACFAYNDRIHRFIMVGVFIFDIYQLPPSIKTIIIQRCNINVGIQFYLNSEFNNLLIKQSSGVFHLRNKFNIDIITLNQESVVEIKEEDELSTELRFEHLTFEKSLIISENVKTLTLINVKFVDNSIVQIFSNDVQTNIKSNCEIHWYESNKLARIEKYGEDGVVCYINDEN
ncbi:putative LRR containing protein, partial [Trachipleistophora hominis]